MMHKGTVTIETERLILRRIGEDDIDAAFRNWTSDERVTEFLRWKAHPDVTETARIVRGWIGEYSRDDFYHWVIVPKKLSEAVGTIGAVKTDDGLGIVHIGYCIGSRWWHQGITSEALAAIIPFFFGEVGANRIESQHDPANPHSGGVMRKCGMTYEGTLRCADRSNKGIVDACVYSILRDEWEKTAK